MKKRLFLFLLTTVLLVGAFVLAASASSPANTVAEGTCGSGLTWVFDEAGALTVSGTGDMTDFSSLSDAPWAAYRDGIRYINIAYGVETIGDYAFAGCTALEGTQITLPTGVCRIGDSAFEGCSNLTGIVLPSTLGSIYDKAFKDCVALTNITIPVSVHDIRPDVFGGCSNLTIHGYQNSRAESYAADNDIPFTAIQTDIASGTCGEGLTWVLDKTCTLVISGTGAMTNWDSAAAVPWYSYRESIQSVVLTKGVTTIGDYAFYYCSNLTSITIPDGVTTIGNSAFHYCSALTSITIPNGVTTIGYDAFNKGYDLTIHGYAGSVAETYATANAIPFVALPGKAIVASGTCGDALTWTLDDTGTLTISGTGAMEDYYASSAAPWWSYRNSIRFVVLEEGVTTIGRWNFYEYSSLTSVAIPSSVTTIGDSAFYRCSGLTSVAIPMGVTTIGDSAFYRCSGLTSVTISTGVTTIGDSAFSGCNSLSSVTIPSSVTSIGCCAFNGCSSLTSITVPDGVTSIGESAFGNCSGLTSISFPSSVISLGGANAFNGCSSLAAVHVDENNKIYSDMDGILFNKTQSQLIRFPSAMVDTAYTIPSSVTAIGGYAFHDCSNLTSITIPSSVNLIGYCAFYGCSNLKSITIPEGVTSISDHAFSYCENLTSVTLPASVTSIGKYTFWNCSDLTSITIPEGVTAIDYAAFEYCSSLKSMTVPSGVVSISGATFNGCSSLSSITISSSVTSIGDLAFGDCSSLTNITIPSSVIAIGRSAFSGCSGMTNVTIPSSVITIGESAFSDCSKMTSITIPSSVTSIGNYAFSRCTGLTIHGNAGSAAELYAINNAIPFVVLPIEVIIASGTCGDALTWTLDEEGNLTISGTGEMSNYGFNNRPWKAFLESITSVVIEEGVTSIGNYAFRDCTNLTSITLPEGLIEIGGWAFNGCVNLKSITLPDSLISIGEAAFIYCESITALHIPAGVTEIGRWAFSECISLPAFTVAEGNTAFSVDAEGVLFDKNKTILVAYPDGKTDATYIIPEGVTTVGEFAFNLCDSLTSVTLPNSLTTLETGAFEDCIGLTSVTIPADMISIGSRAFEACSSLTAFAVEEGNTAFVVIDGVLFSADKTRLVSYPAGKPTANYAIPDGVTAIDSLLFYQCSNLTDITIPSSVTSIGSSAFFGCTDLTIHGYSGSTAEAYAASNNIPFVALQAETIAITVNIPASLGSAVTAPEGGWKVGENTFSVKAESACAVVVSYDGGKTYTRLTATANTDGSYNFTAANMTADTVVAVALRGDANGDGKITNADVTRMNAANLGKITIDAFNTILNDVNGDGKFTNADVTRMNAANLGKISLGWN